MRVCVVGLGKIGLPLAAAIADAEAGHEVVGYDRSEAVVDSVNRGVPPFPNEPGLEERLQAQVDTGVLRATTDPEDAVAKADVVAVAVPLVIDDQARPDFDPLDDVTATIGRHARAGVLVVYETTVPPGTVRGRFAPTLEAATGLTPGDDLFVAFSPERVSSGRVFRDLATYPKIVGGIDPASGERAADFYRSFLSAEVWLVANAETAELTKIAETLYRDVNIAFANEMALLAERWGADIRQVIEASNSQPYSHIHDPGIGVGGHCIPVYPHLVLPDFESQLLRVSRAINDGMAEHHVARLEAALGGLAGQRVLILGLAFRGEVKEDAFSVTYRLRERLEAAGTTVEVDDPLYTPEEIAARGFQPRTGEPLAAVVLQADHAEYRALGPGDLGGAKIVVDGRGVLDPGPFAAAGVTVITIGSA